MSLFSLELVAFFPKFKILDFQIMCIWPFRHVDSVVIVLCTKVDSNICYCH